MRGDKLLINEESKVGQFKTAFFDEKGDQFSGRNAAVMDFPETEVEFVLIGGKRLKQKPYQYGPFVATNKQGISDALMDYELAMNGFEKRKSWNSLISYGVSKSMVDGALNGNLEKELRQRRHIWNQRINISI